MSASLREHLLAAMVRLDDGSPRMLVRINMLAALKRLDESDLCMVERKTDRVRIVDDPPLAEGQKFEQSTQVNRGMNA